MIRSIVGWGAIGDLDRQRLGVRQAVGIHRTDLADRAAQQRLAAYRAADR